MRQLLRLVYYLIDLRKCYNNFKQYISSTQLTIIVYIIL